MVTIPAPQTKNKLGALPLAGIDRRRDQEGDPETERKFIVATVMMDGESKTVLRIGKQTSRGEKHRDIKFDLESEARNIANGPSFEVQVKGGGIILIDPNEKGVFSAGSSRDFGPADPKAVAELLKSGFQTEFKGFKICCNDISGSVIVEDQI
jgi:hypothetical protein